MCLFAQSQLYITEVYTCIETLLTDVNERLCNVR